MRLQQTNLLTGDRHCVRLHRARQSSSVLYLHSISSSQIDNIAITFITAIEEVQRPLLFMIDTMDMYPCFYNNDMVAMDQSIVLYMFIN